MTRSSTLLECKLEGLIELFVISLVSYLRIFRKIPGLEVIQNMNIANTCRSLGLLKYDQWLTTRGHVDENQQLSKDFALRNDMFGTLVRI